MAPRYQNGLRFDTAGGHMFSRWMVEFATQILGWTLYDNNDAGWSSTIGTGADAATTTNADELDFSGSAYTLTAADVGRYVTMLGNAGWSAGEKLTIGIYRIIRVDASAEIAYLDIKRGVHENGLPLSKSSVSFRIWDTTTIPANNTWAIIRSAYLHTPSEPNMDVKVTAGAANTRYPLVAIGPFGTWNSTGHAWNDSRNTVDKSPDFGTQSTTYVFAYGDETDNDHFIVGAYRNDGQIHTYYLGAIDPTAGTVTDTNPGIILAGRVLTSMCWGYGENGEITDAVRMMAYNSGADDVAVTGYLLGPSIVPNITNDNLFWGAKRMWSEWSRSLYRIEPMIQCRTSTHMEARGAPKNFWFTNLYQALIPFGSSMEYLHLKGGIAIPWNGSKVHVQLNFS